MSKTEKVFWGILLALAGIIIGMLAVSFLQAPSKRTCDNGISEQIEDGVKKKTYIPANDTCKEEK